MGTFQEQLRHRQRFNRIERYAIGIIVRGKDGEVISAGTGGLPASDRRRMRNARKAERHAV